MGVKVLIVALGLVLVGLQYRLWLSDDGMQEASRLRTQIEEQRQENERLRERNRTLAAEVQDLKKGTTAIEERARTDLGMIGKSETFYQVVAPRPATSQDQKAGSDAAPHE
jgi:cell division protein FtsB